jgi:hypothetical protein
MKEIRGSVLMEPVEFIHRLSELHAEDIAALASHLRHELDTADGEVAWWRATITIGATIKRQHRSREAGLAAHRASVAVIEAAAKADAPLNREDVTVVARAASEVARVLIIDQQGDLANTAAAVVLAPWAPLVLAAA